MSRDNKVSENRVSGAVRHIRDHDTGANGWLAYWINSSLWAQGKAGKIINVYETHTGRSYKKESTLVFSGMYAAGPGELYANLAECLERKGFELS